MTEEDFLPHPYLEQPAEATITYRAPSNIALIKYWGKRPPQLPANPSISFTLEGCTTTTSVTFRKKEKPTPECTFELFFEGEPKAAFTPKIQTFFKRIAPYLPFLTTYHLTVQTSNSFPHSSGIASSASGMAALALCLVAFESCLGVPHPQEVFNQKASFLARLGSGSACRSIGGGIVQWGAHPSLPESSNVYAIPYPLKVHPLFQQFQDTILLVDRGQKQLSSTVGHQLMHGHPFAENRFAQARDNLEKLQPIFATGNLEAFTHIVESEALSLHAMMMTSDPYFMLMKPHTLAIIQKLWAYRRDTKLPISFTLDAGANVHLLYPATVKEKALQFIQDELIVHCHNEQYICDQVGSGAQKITSQ